MLLRQQKCLKCDILIIFRKNNYSNNFVFLIELVRKYFIRIYYFNFYSKNISLLFDSWGNTCDCFHLFSVKYAISLDIQQCQLLAKYSAVTGLSDMSVIMSLWLSDITRNTRKIMLLLVLVNPSILTM